MILKNSEQHTNLLQDQIVQLKAELFEANSIIEAIREGHVDALVLHNDGQPQVYSLESADYTYRILIEKFGEGALSISDSGLILYCNDYFSKMIGIAASEITGTYIDAYVDDITEFQKLKNEVKSGISKGEIVLQAGGKELHVYVSLTDLHPNVDAIGVVITDLSEKRKHERALLDYQRKLELKVNELNLTNTNLEQFIHVISHDIKEPLRKILTYTSHLTNTSATAFSASELKNLTIINTAALRLNSLVDDLVKYAFSATKDETEKVDLNKILKDVLDDLEIVITENKAEIEFGELPEIYASKVQMRQLFANLISNAIKYSKRNVPPKINITSKIHTNENSGSEAEKWYVISVADSGIGMDKMHLNKIFTIFQRLHLRTEYSGNGIGLAICKKIMENHHGKIDVESELGQGSTFYLHFPIIST
jgi:PAS domain S-box-containing protein